MDRYLYYQNLAVITEFGFTKLIDIFHIINADFDFFRSTLIIVFLLTVRWFIFKYTDYTAFVIALFSIFPYCLDVAQLRNSIGMVFIIFGINILISDKGKHALIKYVFLVLLASSMHFTLISYLILTFSRLFSTVKTFLFLVGSWITMLVLYLNQTILFNIINLIINEDRLLLILDFASKYPLKKVINFSWGSVFCSLLIFSILYISKLKLKNRIECFSEKHNMINILYKIQILSLAVVPLFFLSVDIYRIPRNLIWLGYVGWIPNLVLLKNESKFIESLFNKVMMVTVVIIIFMVQIYGMGNLESTFMPLLFYK